MQEEGLISSTNVFKCRAVCTWWNLRGGGARKYVLASLDNTDDLEHEDLRNAGYERVQDLSYILSALRETQSGALMFYKRWDTEQRASDAVVLSYSRHFCAHACNIVQGSSALSCAY